MCSEWIPSRPFRWHKATRPQKAVDKQVKEANREVEKSIHREKTENEDNAVKCPIRHNHSSTWICCFPCCPCWDGKKMLGPSSGVLMITESLFHIISTIYVNLSPSCVGRPALRELNLKRQLALYTQWVNRNLHQLSVPLQSVLISADYRHYPCGKYSLRKLEEDSGKLITMEH